MSAHVSGDFSTMVDLFSVANLAGSLLERLYIIIVERDQEMFRISIAREMERFYGLQCKGWVPWSWSRSNKLSEQERLYLEYSYSVSIGRRQERLYMYLENMYSIGQQHSTVMVMTRWFVLVVSCFLGNGYYYTSTL
jgi:hypothetical protein